MDTIDGVLPLDSENKVWFEMYDRWERDTGCTSGEGTEGGYLKLVCEG